MDDNSSPSTAHDSSFSDYVDSTTAASRDFTAVALGEHLIRPWYSSGYPKRLVGDSTSGNCRLFVCELCFKYTVDIAKAVAHRRWCMQRHTATPGTPVYHGDDCTIYEVDGEEHTLFCQNLSLFARMFLDTKSICFDVESFLFYTLVQKDLETQLDRVVGFFSKEKMSWDDYNLACILVFPPYQRRGLGKRLIAFSYELSRRERKIGSPEKPLSDLGLKGYVAFWSYRIVRALMQYEEDVISVNDLSALTYLHPDDVVITLEKLGVVLDRNSRDMPTIDLRKCGRLMKEDANFDLAMPPEQSESPREAE